jgi:hypothetical protein
MPGYLCGMTLYVLAAELALSRVLVGNLPRPGFPQRLRGTAPARWRREADFALRHADAHARGGEAAACVGKCSFSVLAEAPARLCERGEWTLNEKGLVDRAGLAGVEKLLAAGHASDLNETVRLVRAEIPDAR